MKRNAIITLAITCIILAAVALVFNWGKFIPEEKKKPEPAYKTEKETLAVRIPEKEKVYKIKKEIESLVPKEKPAGVPETPAIAPRIIRVEKSFEEIHQEVINFFDYLDQKDYIKAYKLKKGTYKHFLKLMERLSANPPVVSGETQDIYILTHNIAHFYRVIGKKNISLIKDIFSNEREITEPTMGLIYEWGTKGIEDDKKEIKTSMKDLYEYAGFFLNTLGGKAYLSRRDSKTRMLVTYYSILILDKTNKEKLNRHGIDIRPPLTLLLDDIHNQKNLDRKTEYLKKLNAIKNNWR